MREYASVFCLCVGIITAGCGDLFFAAKDNVSRCLVSMELPKAPLGISNNGFPGGSDKLELKIRARIGAAGYLEEQSFDGGTAPLRQLTEMSLRASKFNPSCRGRMIELVFIYRVKSTSPTTGVTVEADNRFVLDFPPEKPDILYVKPKGSDRR